MKTIINETLDTVSDMEKYDAACKMLLSQKVILAWILKHCIEEFRNFSADKIVKDFIEGDPQIDTEDSMPMIRGMNPENVDVKEGRITGDIRFFATTPQGKRWIIDVEAQRRFHPKYSLPKRGAYYLGRMISAQKGIEFTGSHYEQLKKTFVIWVCLEPPKMWNNVITGYDVSEYYISGEGSLQPEEYELMTQIIIGLGDPEDELAIGVLRLLDVMFSTHLHVEKKKQIMSSEFGIAMTEELEEGVKEMCNFSEAILERGMKEGIERGIEQGIEQGIVKGESRLNALNEKLVSDGRMDDLFRAIKDEWFRQRLYEEYGLIFSI